MAKAYKIQVQELKVELADAQDNLNAINEELDSKDDDIAHLTRLLSEEKDKVARYKKALHQQCNNIAHLAEQGLIEAQEKGNVSDHASLQRLLGRLEGHIRGIINATGCEFHVQPESETTYEHQRRERLMRDELQKKPSEHGSVNYKHEEVLELGRL